VFQAQIDETSWFFRSAIKMPCRRRRGFPRILAPLKAILWDVRKPRAPSKPSSRQAGKGSGEFAENDDCLTGYEK
jgi:hypothetical protein